MVLIPYINSARWILMRLFWFIEQMIYQLSYVTVIPIWIKFVGTHPQAEYLSYSDLVRMVSQYPLEPKPGIEARYKHQKKWAMRVARLAQIRSAKNILEIGAGQGYASSILHKLGFNICSIDLYNHITSSIHPATIGFTVSDALFTPFVDNSFDMIFSINSFEHIEQPEAVLDEMLRIVKPGGTIYLAFSPIYYSSRGLHASRRLGMPYPQLLFSAEDIQRYVDENAALLEKTYDDVSEKNKIGPFLNEYSVEQYRQIFKNRRSRFKVVSYIERPSYEGLPILRQHLQIIKAKVPSFDNLIVSGIKVVVTKPVALQAVS